MNKLIGQQIKERMEQQAIPHDTVEDVPDAPASKPMTFAERMAAAKKAAKTRKTGAAVAA